MEVSRSSSSARLPTNTSRSTVQPTPGSDARILKRREAPHTPQDRLAERAVGGLDGAEDDGEWELLTSSGSSSVSASSTSTNGDDVGEARGNSDTTAAPDLDTLLGVPPEWPAGNWQPLWDYMQPHLIRHKGSHVPHRQYVRELITLPRIRDLQFNLARMGSHPYVDSHPRDVSALIIQLTGDVAAKPCTRCEDGKGPFWGCVMLSAKARVQPLKSIFSCANCYYHSNGTYCSNRSLGAKRAEQVEVERMAIIKAHPSLSWGFSTPVAAAHETEKSRSAESDAGAAEKKTSAAQSPVPSSHWGYATGVSADAIRRQKENWDYIQPYLTHNKVAPTLGYVQELLTQRRLRDLELNPARPPNQPYDEKTARDVAAMIIQITGEQMPSVVASCTRCKQGKGPFATCVVIDRRAHPDARSRYIACANCIYHGKQTFCTHKTWRRGSSRTSSALPGDGADDDDDNDEHRNWEDQDVTMTDFGESRLRQQPASSTCTIIPTIIPTKRGRGRPPKSSYATPASQAQTSSALISGGQLQTDDILEMETWEMAPGRIRETRSAKPENIAYSKSYLSTNHTVSVCEDVGFRIDTITSGGTLRFGRNADEQTRLCSLASGKVRVKIGDKPEFAIGPHGMFKVRPGVECTVQNWMYIDAVLHVTLLSGFPS
ncbi:hypothetical protein QBC46DRAFT_265828 [Diplogelasinospora grovesii]|uniref:Uncharacterized protein n=1 Tax=Diplogelasinospora grovesii TaxID=303347 RepID=A0AAN6N441_9PEZI|nr:hypothetical protein QBC46DRAFT_265828 [Diplogelasinospora grovesii]